jgi:hypothetical protein
LGNGLAANPAPRQGNPRVVTFAKLKRSPNSTWLLFTAAVGLLLILAAALGGLIQRYLGGEDLLIYHYANNLPHFQAFLKFFHEFGRPIEAFYWTYQYKLLGFNPLVLHSLSFVLLLIMSILAAACFLNAWPQSNRSKALPYMFVFLLFTSWVSVSSVFRLSYDNGRISLIFFFLAGLALQRWAVGQRGRWLLLSFAFFLLSVLTYENAAFLFPALLLLAWPLFPKQKKDSVRNRAFLFVGLAAVSGLLLLIPRWLYSYITRMQSGLVVNPSQTVGLSDMPSLLLKTGPAIFSGFGQFGVFGAFPLNFLMAFGLVVILALSSIWIFRIYGDARPKETSETKSRWFSIYLASLWFLIFGPLPYVLLGYDIGGRIYSSAVFGVFGLLLMVYETSYKRFFRVLAVALVFLFAGFGLLQVKNESVQFNQAEAENNIFYRGLKDAVPFVRQNTVFIFINGPGGYTGCGASLEMLYDQNNLKCVIFNSTYSKYQAIRHLTEIEAGGQHLSGNNWILFTVTNNVPVVLDELRPGDFDLLLTWESTEPIHTDYQKIVTKNIPPPSRFYLNLLQRAAILFSNK